MVWGQSFPPSAASLHREDLVPRLEALEEVRVYLPRPNEFDDDDLSVTVRSLNLPQLDSDLPQQLDPNRPLEGEGEGFLMDMLITTLRLAKGNCISGW